MAPHASHRPTLVTVVRRVSLSLLVAVVVPAAVFYGTFALAGDFYPMDHELAVRPRVRRLFRHLTALWAALGFAKAGMTLWLLQSQTLETFVLVKSVSMLAINVLAAFATIGLAALVARKEGLMGSTRPAPVPAEAPA